MEERVIEKEKLLNFIKEKKEKFEFLHSITGVDYPEYFQIVYHLYSLKNEGMVVKVNIKKEEPSVETLSNIYKTANWQEREIYDLFGINFISHPNLKRILLPDKWEGHPLRKDYTQEEENLIVEKARERKLE